MLGLAGCNAPLSCSVMCGILLPQPGIELASPALQGGLLATGPPGKSLVPAFWLHSFMLRASSSNTCNEVFSSLSPFSGLMTSAFLVSTAQWALQPGPAGLCLYACVLAYFTGLSAPWRQGLCHSFLYACYLVGADGNFAEQTFNTVSLVSCNKIIWS